MEFKINFKLCMLAFLAVEVIAGKAQHQSETDTSKSLSSIGKSQKYILFLHAITGCDSKSAFYWRGETTVFKMFEKQDLLPCPEVCQNDDFPCMPILRNQSVVCVCNATYCDTITRIEPDSGTYIAYTSSKLGLRFSKKQGNIETLNSPYGNGNYGKVFELRPNKLYQVIEGFGGAATDSAGINWKKMNPAIQKHLINSYYSEKGIEYNMVRLPIGSTDFSTRFYTYNEYPEDDKFLTNFTFVPEDINYKIPLIKACLDAATTNVDIVAATWSPPIWMKNKEPTSGISFIKDEYFQSYADYHCKFAELYKQEGIHIWGISTGNEPLINIIAGVSKEATAWSSPKMAKFIANYFGPTIRNCSVKNMKVLAVDDQRYAIPLYFTMLEEVEPDVMDYIDGIAVHFYGDKVTPASIITQALKKYPEKFAIGTEACLGANEEIDKVLLGSWNRAKVYFMDILEDLNYNMVGWIDWNLFLDIQGGPNWLSIFVDSPIIVDVEKQEFYKQPIFYALGHFSKFVPRGSQRIKVVTVVPAADPDLDLIEIASAGAKFFDNVAFITPNGTIVVVIQNEGQSQNCAIQLGDLQATVYLEEESITTIEIPYDGNTLGSSNHSVN